ncbi:hypothetical protein GCM10017566_05090 [Amycolatopsis bartoniae]|uniref:Uncharacterized protein n=1 Tax=Amycolatopsis bartoniae TaxID=941986 RepID=A0A8H9IMJ7_9PSEU|nr:hypothetical protein GCM10017566_05090 [Amycolatopsis bartoniae]
MRVPATANRDGSRGSTVSGAGPAIVEATIPTVTPRRPRALVTKVLLPGPMVSTSEAVLPEGIHDQASTRGGTAESSIPAEHKAHALGLASATGFVIVGITGTYILTRRPGVLAGAGHLRTIDAADAHQVGRRAYPPAGCGPATSGMPPRLAEVTQNPGPYPGVNDAPSLRP